MRSQINLSQLVEMPTKNLLRDHKDDSATSCFFFNYFNIICKNIIRVLIRDNKL